MDEGLGIAPKKLLIVEDDFYIRDLYKIEAQNNGFVVYEAENGTDGLDIAKVARPDVILLDIMLPQISGVDVLKTIRSWEGFADLPIVMFTNVTDEKTQADAKTAGATDYLLKYDHSPKEVIDILVKYIKK